MVSSSIALLVANALAANGPQSLGASAINLSPEAFIASGASPAIEQFEPARGDARLSVIDRTAAEEGPSGDEARFDSHLRVGLDDFRITLVETGVHRSEEQGLFPFALEGGVQIDRIVLGRTGKGFRGAADARAAIAVFGLARVERNGQVIDPASPIQVYALSAGIHADDDTHRRLPVARMGDAELIIYLPRVASDRVPNGFLLATFDDVRVEISGRVLVAVREIPAGGFLPPGPPIILEIADLPRIPPPRFRRPSTAGAFAPLEPIRPPRTPDPITRSPAIPLPSSVPVLHPVSPFMGASVPAGLPAVPLPQGITPLNAVPPPIRALSPGVAPLNAAPAVPLVPGIAPLSATAPASTP